MAATKEDVSRWIEVGIRNGSRYLVSVCDTFSYEDYPVYCKDDKELAEAEAKYRENMQRVNEVINLDEKRAEKAAEEEDHYAEDDLKYLSSILAAVMEGKIEAGINKKYCFVTDEDGYLVFLKRPSGAVLGQPDPEMDGEPRTQWPYNCYDGKVLYKQYCGENRGISITEDFLNALNIEFLG